MLNVPDSGLPSHLSIQFPNPNVSTLIGCLGGEFQIKSKFSFSNLSSSSYDFQNAPASPPASLLPLSLSSLSIF